MRNCRAGTKQRLDIRIYVCMCVYMYMYVYTVCNWSNREEPDEIGTMQSLEMMVELCI